MKKSNKIEEVVINQKAAKWCFDRGYKIYPKPIEYKDQKYGGKLGIRFKLVVEFGGDKKIGTKEYTQSEWPIAIWSVYNFLYNKHNGEKA